MKFPRFARPIPFLFLCLPLALLLAFGGPAAEGCIGYFGMTAVGVSDADAISNAFDTTAGFMGVAPEGEDIDIVADVDFVASRLGPISLNLEQILFEGSHSQSPVDCRHYERGPASAKPPLYGLLSGFRGRLDTFFAVNGALFSGDVKVRNLVIHSEANNACVENSKLEAVAAYVRAKLDQPGYYQPRIVAVYGLVEDAYGLPVDGQGQIAKFPQGLDAIGYTAYDVFKPGDPGHVDNVNPEPWDSIRAKIETALHPHQTTIGVFKAYCQPNGAVEMHWGVTCPNQVSKLGQAALHWRDYLLQDVRNEGIYGFHWPDVDGSPGANALPTIWSQYDAIVPAENCTPVYDRMPDCDTIFEDSFESGDLSAWDDTYTELSGTLRVAPSTGLVGFQGLDARVTGAGDRAFVRDFLAAPEATYRARFYFRTGPGTLADGNQHRIFTAHDTATPWVILVEVRRSGTDLQLRARTRLDDGSKAETPWLTFQSTTEPAEMHRAEVTFRSRPGSDGSLRLEVDGTSTGLLALDNDTHRIVRAALGMVHQVDAGTTGSFAFDYFLSCRD